MASNETPRDQEIAIAPTTRLLISGLRILAWSVAILGTLGGLVMLTTGILTGNTGQFLEATTFAVVFAITAVYVLAIAEGIQLLAEVRACLETAVENAHLHDQWMREARSRRIVLLVRVAAWVVGLMGIVLGALTVIRGVRTGNTKDFIDASVFLASCCLFLAITLGVAKGLDSLYHIRSLLGTHDIVLRR